MPKRSPGKKNKGGRPTKYDTATAERVIALIRAGNYVETAAAAAGWSKSTLYDYLKQGARPNAPPDLKWFSDAVEKALAEAEARDVALIARAAESQWQAAAWRLERRAPDKWGRRERVTIEKGVDEGAVGQLVKSIREAAKGVPEA